MVLMLALWVMLASKSSFTKHGSTDVQTYFEQNFQTNMSLFYIVVLNGLCMTLKIQCVCCLHVFN